MIDFHGPNSTLETHIKLKMDVIFLLSAMLCLSYAEINYDKSKWIDPTDMVRDYSQQKKEMEAAKEATQPSKKLEDAPNGTQNCSCPPVEVFDVSALREELEKCEKQLQKIPAPEAPFFRQYTANILDRVKSFTDQVDIREEVLVNVQMSLRSPDLRELRAFSEGKGKVQDAHSILVEMIQQVEEAEPLPDMFSRSYDWLMENATIVCLFFITLAMVRIAMSVHVRYNMSWISLIYKLIILAFIVSIPWNWWHLYKQEVAKRYADMLQEVPPDCKPKHQQTLWDSLVRSMSLDVDECAKYHQRIMIDPFWEVPPTKAVAVTVTKFAVEPIEIIGGALNGFLQKTLHGLPVYLWPIAIFFSVLMLILTMVMAFGYRMNLCYLFGIEPPQYRPGVNEHFLQDENNSLKDKLANSERKVQSLESQLSEMNLALTATPRHYATQATLQPLPPPYPMVHAASRRTPETIGYGPVIQSYEGYDERDCGTAPELRRRHPQPAEHVESTELKYPQERGSGEPTTERKERFATAAEENHVYYAPSTQVKHYPHVKEQNRKSSKARLVPELDEASNQPMVGLVLDALVMEETVSGSSEQALVNSPMVKTGQQHLFTPSDTGTQSENIIGNPSDHLISSHTTRDNNGCGDNSDSYGSIGFEVIESFDETAGSNIQPETLHAADPCGNTRRDSSDHTSAPGIAMPGAVMELRENSDYDQSCSITTHAMQQDRLSDDSALAPPSHTATILETDPNLLAQQPPVPSRPSSLQNDVETIGNEM